MHHYPFHPGDYLLHTAHLEPMADLCYRRCLDLYYSTEAPLANDKQTLSKRLRVDERTLSEVLKEFFSEHEDGWHSSRCDSEIAKYQARSQKAKVAGSQGGKARKKRRQANAKQTLSESLANQNQNQNQLTPISPQPPAPPSLDLEVETLPASIPQEQIEVASWFGRRPTTEWSEKELKAWGKIPKPIDPDDWKAIRWYYTQSGCAYLRKDLVTLLNNWTSEIDRAKNYDPNAK